MGQKRRLCNLVTAVCWQQASRAKYFPKQQKYDESIRGGLVSESQLFLGGHLGGIIYRSMYAGLELEVLCLK